MSFPVVESKATSVTSSSLTTHTISTPSGVVDGDLLIAFIALENITSPGGGQFSGWSDGFIEIVDKTTGGAAGASVGIAYKLSDASEGANITVTSVDAERAAHAMYRISGALRPTALPPDVSAGASGLSSAPDPDNLAPAAAFTKEYMWMAFCAFEKDDETITGFPTSYGSNQTNHSMASGATIGIATRDLDAVSENPGVFAMSGSEEWQAFTLAVIPVPEVTLSGTITASVDEIDIRTGGKTAILTVKNDKWLTVDFDDIRQDVINGFDSAQAEGTGWDAEVKAKAPVTDVVRTSDFICTVTFSAQGGYDITAQETIAYTGDADTLDLGETPEITAPGTFTVDVGPAAAALTGTLVPTSLELGIVAGGQTLIITLENDSWVASGGTFDAIRQDIIDGLTSAQSELLGWNNEVRDKEVVGAVVRTSASVVTITLSAAAAYNITAPETITGTIPASALLASGSPVVATPTFQVNQIPTAVIFGTIAPSSTEAEVVAGGKTITINLTDDTFVAAGAPFLAVRQAIIDGITSAQSELLGWNNEVRDNEVVTAVVRSSDTLVTITLSASGSYDITANETITVTVPASALVTSGSPVVGAPTFQITFVAPPTGGTTIRDRRGGKHTESAFGVTEAPINTPDVNSF